MSDRVLFFSKFLKSPKEVGSIFPSSKFLARKMMEPIRWGRVRTVAELGAGTGIFTRAIRKRMFPTCKALIFEQDDGMRKRLAAQYPEMIFCKDARELTAEMKQHGIAGLDCIVSGLPFANFEPALRDAIMSEVMQGLKPGGLFITFQYSLQMKKHLQSRFSSVEIAFVLLNMLPSFVYVCRK